MATWPAVPGKIRFRNKTPSSSPFAREDAMTRSEKIEYCLFQLLLITLGGLFYHLTSDIGRNQGHTADAYMGGLLACAVVGLAFGFGGMIADNERLAISGFNIMVPAAGCIIWKLAVLAWASWWAVTIPAALAMFLFVVILALVLLSCWAVLSGVQNSFENTAFATMWIFATYAIIIANFVVY